MIRASQALNLLRFCAGSYKPRAGPLKVNWNVTNLCNSRCKSCERWQRPKDKNELTTEEGYLLLRQLARNKVADISFSGGEPLLRRDIFELVTFAKQQGLRISLDTNGSLLTRSVAQQICAAGIDRVYLSLNGASSGVHDELRGVAGSFRKVMEAITFLQKERVNATPQIFSNVTISKENVHNFSQIVELAYKRKMDGMTFHLAHNIGEKNFHLSEKSAPDLRDVSRLQREIDIMRRKYPSFFLDDPRYYGNFTTFLENPEKLYKYRCIAGYLRCDIESNGDVLACDVAGYHLGNVRIDSFKDIWYSERANLARRRIRENDHPLCWLNCIGPTNVMLHDVHPLRILQLVHSSLLRKTRRLSSVRGTILEPK